MNAVAECVEFWETVPGEVSWAFYDHFSGFFGVEMQRKHGDFGSKLLMALTDVGTNAPGVSLDKAYHRIATHFISLGPKTSSNIDAYNAAEAKGMWLFCELLSLSKMGDSMKSQVVEERGRLEEMKAMAHNFLSANKCMEKEGEGKEMMVALTKSMIECFDKKVPLSEDLLFISWTWAKATYKEKVLESPLWQNISRVLKKVLAIPLNPRDWAWFKMNVFKSAVTFFCLLFSETFF